MRPAKVVVREVDREGRSEILPLLGECVGKPGQAAHLHPHREVLPLDVGGADPVGKVGAALRLRMRADQLDRLELDGFVVLHKTMGPVYSVELTASRRAVVEDAIEDALQPDKPPIGF